MASLESSQGGLPFIGRYAHLAAFRHDIQAVRDGKPRVVLVPGEIGVGKSRLLTECRRLAVQERMQVYSGSCYEGRTLPYLPFVEVLQAHRTQAMAQVPSMQGADAALLNRFLNFAGAPPPVASTSPLTESNQDMQQLFVALTRIIVRLTRWAPTLIIIDDLHCLKLPSI